MTLYNRPLHVRTLLLAVLLLCAAPPSGAASSSFPTKPIRLIVPFPPGGSNDILSRYVGAKLGDRLGQQIVIDNRGGANGIIGAETVANADPDGYTLLFVSTSWVMNAAVRKLPYDVEKSFDPLATIASAPNSIVVHPKGPYATLKDLVAAAKAKPGSLNYAHTGVGGFNHFGGELFKKVAGINMQPVAYKGGGPAMIDVMAGNIPIMFSSVTQALPHVRNNRLKFLAVGSEKRNPAVPDVPTVAESGYPGYGVSVWWGMVAPNGTPKGIEDKIRRELAAVLDAAETKSRLLNEAAVPMPMTPAQMRKMIQADVKKWRDVAKTAGIKVK
jgi:tripartite-type tricarboxylate transporter receptor subunit TctC